MAAFVALFTHCAVLTSPLGSEGAASAGADADGACFAMEPEKLAKLIGESTIYYLCHRSVKQ